MAGFIYITSSHSWLHPPATSPGRVWAHLLLPCGCVFQGDAVFLAPWPCSMPTVLMFALLLSCSRSTQSRRSLSQRPWWSWRSCREASSPSSSRLPKSLRCQRAVNPLPSTGESFLSPHLFQGPTGWLALTAPDVASLCSSSYDGFPELRAELFESPREQPGALPVPGPSRSAPSSPAPRRTQQVTGRWAPEAPGSG